MTSSMKKFLFIFIVMVCGCVNQSNQPRKTLEAYFFSGDSEDSPVIVSPNSFTADSAVTYKIIASEYNYLFGVVSKHKVEIAKEIKPPTIFIKIGSIQYIIGDNRVVKVGSKHFMISEREESRIKSIIHYYDFMCHEDVKSCAEVRKYGIPANYRCVVHGKHCIPRDRKIPLKVLVPPRPPFKKVILQVR